MTFSFGARKSCDVFGDCGGFELEEIECKVGVVGFSTVFLTGLCSSSSAFLAFGLGVPLLGLLAGFSSGIGDKDGVL